MTYLALSFQLWAFSFQPWALRYDLCPWRYACCCGFSFTFRNPWPVQCGANFTGSQFRNPHLNTPTFLWMTPWVFISLVR